MVGKVVQQPELQGALVALDAQTGAVRALVGGYDFHRRTRLTVPLKHGANLVHSFKPFIYSAALAKGVTAATPINDAPISLPEYGLGWSSVGALKTRMAVILVIFPCIRLWWHLKTW